MKGYFPAESTINELWFMALLLRMDSSLMRLFITLFYPAKPPESGP